MDDMLPYISFFGIPVFTNAGMPFFVNYYEHLQLLSAGKKKLPFNN